MLDSCFDFQTLKTRLEELNRLTAGDIEQKIKDLEELQKITEKKKVNVSASLQELAAKVTIIEQELYSNLSGWQKVLIARHPQRPYSSDYIKLLSTSFIELHGDRNFKDDKAMVGGLAEITSSLPDGSSKAQSVMMIGHQKGRDTKSRTACNFGMAHPEGYRKALRLMKMAEKFNIPIITLIDTPGAFPGIEAEERGQAEAIARNLLEMSVLKVPVICFVIGEGASGGAIGIGVGNKIYMLEHAWYSVISPESCSTILWKTVARKEKMAESLKLTAQDMLTHKLIDGIVPEPFGGAHKDPAAVAEAIKTSILKDLGALKKLSPDELINDRVGKFSAMGLAAE